MRTGQQQGQAEAGGRAGRTRERREARPLGLAAPAPQGGGGGGEKTPACWLGPSLASLARSTRQATHLLSCPAAQHRPIEVLTVRRAEDLR